MKPLTRYTDRRCGPASGLTRSGAPDRRFKGVDPAPEPFATICMRNCPVGCTARDKHGMTWKHLETVCPKGKMLGLRG